MEILSINGLSKSFGKIQALNKLSLQIQAGEVWGILGPNGSGKTTTLSILLGVLAQSNGNFLWFGGESGFDYRLRIGAILETPNFYPYLNAEENLAIIAKIKHAHQPNIDYLLETVGLSDRKKSKFSTYSLGMKQRLAIAAAMIGDPEVLIFDEPTNGLDPIGIVEVRDILLKIAQTGKTILMASHILDEVEKICSHVAILKSGHLLTAGHISTILGEKIFLEIGAEDKLQLESFLSKFEEITILKKFHNYWECSIPSSFDLIGFKKSLMEKIPDFSHFVVRKQKLEEEFVSLVKN